MSTLDDKLRWKLIQYVSGYNKPYAGDRTADYVDGLKQLFTDAGYIDFSKYEKEFAEYEDVADKVEAEDELMTGQQWYERFQAELKGQKLARPASSLQVAMGDVSLRLATVLETAKRAAGLDKTD